MKTDAAEAPGSRFWLSGAGLEVVLHQGEDLLGRAPEAHVRIASRRHPSGAA